MNDCAGRLFFENHTNRVMKPIVFLTGSIYRMFCFLYLERNPNGRWIFLIYSLLPKKALEGLKAHICIKSEGRNCFAAYLNILPMMSVTKSEAVVSGNVLVLFDEQLKDGENQAKVFDYVVKICTTPKFCAALNHNDKAGAWPSTKQTF